MFLKIEDKIQTTVILLYSAFSLLILVILSLISKTEFMCEMEVGKLDQVPPTLSQPPLSPVHSSQISQFIFMDGEADGNNIYCVSGVLF